VIAYVDTSVILRIALREPDPLPEWKQVTRAITSSLAVIECNRALLRLAAEWKSDRAAMTEAHIVVGAILSRCDIRHVSARVVRRAAAAFPDYVATLDAIHLATAIIYRDDAPPSRPIHFATHDIRLAKAARGMHFPTLGV
jgi:predicted nucleic acid-binding protein